MNPQLDAGSLRAQKARLARRVGTVGMQMSMLLSGLLLLAAILMMASGTPHAAVIAAAGLAASIWTLWLRGDLMRLPAAPPAGKGPLEDILDPWLLARLKGDESPQQLWELVRKEWRGQFIILRSGVYPEFMAAALPSDSARVWSTAREIAVDLGSSSLHPGHLAAALMAQPEGEALLRAMGIDPGRTIPAISAWLERFLRDLHRERPLYGGLGRDWASGFTPTLEHYAGNVSRAIALSGTHFRTLAGHRLIDEMITALNTGGRPIALVGAIGTGKTTLMTAFAQRLIEGDGGRLAYKQVMMLDAGRVAAGTARTGDTERLVLTCLGEALHAGNIIVALDDAQAFLSAGTGTVDLSGMLANVISSRRLPLILALTPDQWQKLSAERPALAAEIQPIMVPEPPRAEVLAILADTCLTFETRSPGRAVTFGALEEAYELSGRYIPDSAYPGRAIQLLETAVTRSPQGLVGRPEVQAAIEAMFGIKVSDAQGAEADVLLDLEGRIHERMVGQSRAVAAVSAALRRARAGVASPKRPIGSFLFLGPTGVGKTELAKSLAAVYFGDEHNMIRLDMSEYSGPADAARLLGNDPGSLAIQVRERPFSVVLLDELEKAHPNVLNLLLQMLDEGRLTDTAGREVRFRDTIVIATSNAGADEIRKRISKKEDPADFEENITDNLIKTGAFKPELLNRFDDIVIFEPLNESELAQVVRLMLGGVNANLAARQIRVELSDAAVRRLVRDGNDPRLGARPMRRIVQRRVENAVAERLLRGELRSGSTLLLEESDVRGGHESL